MQTEPVADDAPTAVTLDTLHRDLSELKGDVRDVKGLLVSRLPTFPPEWPREVVRLLREGNRLNEERFAQLDVTLREQAIETHTILRTLADGQRQMTDNQRNLSDEIRALVARIDALIRGRGNGPPPA